MPKWKTILLATFFSLSVACQSEQQRAEQVARQYMRNAIGPAAVERAHVEVRPSKVGWMVIFHDANTSCGDPGAGFWPGACRFGAVTYRDAYTCINYDGSLNGQAGASTSPRPLSDEDLCQHSDGATVAPARTATTRRVPPPTQAAAIKQARHESGDA